MYHDRLVAFPLRTAKRGLGAHARALRAQSAGSLLRAGFFASAALSEACAILISALAAGAAYHWLFYDLAGMAKNFLVLGCAIAFLFVAPAIVRDEYAIARFVQNKLSPQRLFVLWNVAFMSAMLLAFLSKTSADESRGTVALFYALGFVSVWGVRSLLARLARRLVGSSSAAARRVFLVGFEEELTRFSERYALSKLGMRIVSGAVLRSEESLDDDLALAAASARILRPEDIFILVPWSKTHAIEACVNAFLRVPASIHLGPERVLDRFPDLHIDRNGPIASLRLVGRPLSMLEISLKRAMDVVGASLGLVALSPLLAILALLIKLGSPGPALFKQRRYGFNQEPFRIYKFRSMNVAEDDRHVRQAGANDPRITAVGAFLRRWNLDELPQLFNVLRGNMSLVGPRPHALAHDQQYERTIALYARRHNVKPGITGWAQVNGHRGEISEETKIRLRVEHDLYYIDHWSLLFDVKILFWTLFSPKAYSNAR